MPEKYIINKRIGKDGSIQL